MAMLVAAVVFGVRSAASAAPPAFAAPPASPASPAPMASLSPSEMLASMLLTASDLPADMTAEGIAAAAAPLLLDPALRAKMKLELAAVAASLAGERDAISVAADEIERLFGAGNL